MVFSWESVTAIGDSAMFEKSKKYTLDKMETEFALTVKSGNNIVTPQQFIRYRNLTKSLYDSLQKVAEEIAEFIFQAANRTIITVENVMVPRIPVKTGKLKNGFLASLSIQEISLNKYYKKVLVQFDTPFFLSLVPYAKFYIEELKAEGISEGIDLDLLYNLMIQFFDEIKKTTEYKYKIEEFDDVRETAKSVKLIGDKVLDRGDN